jgi:hypothetical protein
MSPWDYLGTIFSYFLVAICIILMGVVLYALLLGVWNTFVKKNQRHDR